MFTIALKESIKTAEGKYELFKGALEKYFGDNYCIFYNISESITSSMVKQPVQLNPLPLGMGIHIAQ